MAERERQDGLSNYIAEVERNQRNIVWPDTLRSSRTADAFLWRGSPNPTRVQRIAAWLFGAQFIAIGVVMFSAAIPLGSYPLVFLGAGCLAIGARIFWNGCRRKQSPDSPEHPER